jgi:hypothetical protein
MSEQMRSTRPNAVVDPEMFPAAHTQSRSGHIVALVAFILFSATGGLAWLAP